MKRLTGEIHSENCRSGICNAVSVVTRNLLIQFVIIKENELFR